MIDRLLEILGSLPKQNRKIILKAIDIFTWGMLLVDMVVGLPALWVAINVTICVIMLCLTWRLMQIGGWWWANEEDD